MKRIRKITNRVRKERLITQINDIKFYQQNGDWMDDLSNGILTGLMIALAIMNGRMEPDYKKYPYMRTTGIKNK